MWLCDVAWPCDVAAEELDSVDGELAESAGLESVDSAEPVELTDSIEPAVDSGWAEDSEDVGGLSPLAEVDDEESSQAASRANSAAKAKAVGHAPLL